MEAIQKGEHDMGLLTLLLVFENQKKRTSPREDCDGPVTIHHGHFANCDGL